MQFFIKDILKDKSPNDRIAAIKLYNLLNDRIKNGLGTVLSFNGISSCSTVFLNSSIGKVYIKNDQQKVKELLKIEAEGELINHSIKRVISRAIHFEETKKILEYA